MVRALGHGRLAAAAGLAAALALAAEGDELPLESLLDEASAVPAVADLAWTPDGARFLYKTEQEGRVVWWREDVAKGRRAVAADWTAIQQELLRSRPGFAAPVISDVNAAGGARSTPAFSPDRTRLAGTEAADLYVVDLASGRGRFLTQDPEPELFVSWSPDGRTLAFVRGGDLYAMAVDGGGLRRLTDRGADTALLNGMTDWVYEEELHVRRSYWWSPDGRRLAYVQYDTAPVTTVPIVDDLAPVPQLELQRYPKAGGANARVRLGVVAAEGGATTWIDLGAEPDFYLARVGWTPDGAQLWYEWLRRDQRRLELRVAPADGGRARTLLVEEDLAWVEVGDDLTFVDARRFVWSSERDGWRHLYLYDLDGRLLQRLTQGAWQVEDVSGVDARAAHVFFLATEKDPRERHLYEVGLDGRGLRRLSRAAGAHAVLLAPGGRHYLDVASDRHTPPRLALHAGDGTLLRTLRTTALSAAAAAALGPIELSSLAAEDGTTLYTAMAAPSRREPGRRYPALLYVYGGPTAQLVQDKWGARAELFLRLLASRGLVVFWMDNRGSSGRGKAFASAVHRRLGEVEVQDQLLAARHLRSLPFVDPDRIGIYGGSYGGYMVLRCLLGAPELFRAGVAYSAVTDWRLYDTIYTERYMGTPEDNPDGYRRSAVLGSGARLQAPLLLAHGTMDNNVHLQNALQLADELTREGKPFDLALYPRTRHGIRSSRYKVPFHRRVMEFLFERLAVER